MHNEDNDTLATAPRPNISVSRYVTKRAGVVTSGMMLVIIQHADTIRCREILIYGSKEKSQHAFS